MEKRKSASTSEGCAFEFECEGHRIVAWASPLSGLEKVDVDGQLVASQRNFNKHSENHFMVGDIPCSISLDAATLLRGPYVCTLHRNGVPFKRQRLIIASASALFNRRYWYEIVLLVFLVIVFGELQEYLSLPDWSVWAFICLIVVVGLARDTRKPASNDVFFVEEECD